MPSYTSWQRLSTVLCGFEIPLPIMLSIMHVQGLSICSTDCIQASISSDGLLKQACSEIELLEQVRNACCTTYRGAVVRFAYPTLQSIKALLWLTARLTQTLFNQFIIGDEFIVAIIHVLHFIRLLYYTII